MHRFFDPIVLPLLDAAAPSVVVQIGTGDAHTKELLASWCKAHGVPLHIIASASEHQGGESAAPSPSAAQVRGDLSLNGLADMGACDVLYIDANHETVLDALQVLGEVAAAGRPFPLTLVHRIDRESPHAGDSARSPSDERAQGKGTLVTVQDLVAKDRDLVLHVVPGLGGLGIVVDGKAPSEVLDVVDELVGAPGLLGVLEAVEVERARGLEAQQEAERALALERGRLERIRAEIVRQVGKQRELSAKVEALRNEAGELHRQLARARDSQERQIDSLRKEIRDSESSMEQANAAVHVERERYARLAGRRLVRLALMMARLASPVFRAVRRFRRSGTPST